MHYEAGWITNIRKAVRKRVHAFAGKRLNKAEAELKLLYSAYPPSKCIEGTRVPTLLTMEVNGDMPSWCSLKKSIYFWDEIMRKTKERKQHA